MHSIGEIISKNRKKKGLSQSGLAELLCREGYELTGKAVSKWEKNNTEPSASLFMTVCRILDITDVYEAYYGVNPNNELSLLSQEGRTKALDYISLLHATGLYENDESNIITFRKIDIYETPVSAGTGNFLTDSVKTTMTIDDNNAVPENADFGVRISGDSMEPEFYNGEIAWVTQQNTLDNGDIGIVTLNGEAYIKKIQNDKGGISLVSLNNKYAPISVNENDRFDVFGKVVGKYGCNK
jgi:phage repressor protein C with HTH and peptisase S24 domain